MNFSFGLLKTSFWILITIVSGVLLIMVRRKYAVFTDVKHAADTSWGQLDMVLKNRYREIGRLIQLGDTYITDTCESLNTLKSFTRRSTLVPSRKERIRIEQRIPQDIHTFILASAQYPAIRDHQYFTDAKNKIEHIQSDIDQERVVYNQKAELFNQKIKQFPFTLIAVIQRISPYELFTKPEDTIKLTDVQFDLPLPPLEIKKSKNPGDN